MTSKVEKVRRIVAEPGFTYHGPSFGAIVELDDRLLAHETRLRVIEEKLRAAPAPDAGPQVGDDVEDAFGYRGIDGGVSMSKPPFRQMRRHDGVPGTGDDGAWTYPHNGAKILRRAAEIEEKAMGNPGPEPASGVRAPGGLTTGDGGASSVERASPSSSPGEHPKKARDGRGGDATPTERAGDPTQATAVPGQVAAQPSPSPDPDAELVEELAKALCAAWCGVVPAASPWGSCSDYFRRAYRAEARAALALLHARGWGPKSSTKAARKVRKLTDADAQEAHTHYLSGLPTYAQDAEALNALGYRRVK